ncbi:MAG: hypothetical protein VX777_10825, partial [Chlamydiota bacterium]|nr:hypothetical protein [Chlamydiota bacterium]
MTPLNTNTEGYSFQIPVQYRDTRKKSPDRLSRLSSETLENQNFSSKVSKVKNKVSKILKPKETRVALASKDFHYWNVTYDHHGVTDKAKLLLNWLHYDYGAKLITTYEEFTELVTKLNSGEDNIPKYDINETPSKVEFEKSMIIYARKARISYEPSKETRVALASEEFHYWNVTYDNHGVTNKAKLLLNWLHYDYGAKLIITYEEFTELVTKLNSGEDNIPKYDINETPSKVEFEKSMIIYARKVRISYEASKEARIALASEDFHYWNITYDQRGETNKAKLLLEWLHYDYGAKLITTYEEFTELVTKLNSGEDNIPKYDINETPSKVEFEKSMIIYARKVRISYEASKEARIALASEDFNYWDVKHDQRGETNKAKLLLEWLHCYSGAQLITTYEEFTELVTKLNSGEDN